MMEDFIRNGGSSERAVAAMEREGALNARAGGALSTRRDEQSSVKSFRSEACSDSEAQ